MARSVCSGDPSEVPSTSPSFAAMSARELAERCRLLENDTDERRQRYLVPEAVVIFSWLRPAHRSRYH